MAFRNNIKIYFHVLPWFLYFLGEADYSVCKNILSI